MRYYLDTNVIYNIKKIPVEKLTSSLISILALIELISGIRDDKSYVRRKAIITNVFSRNLMIDWAMPEEIVFDSFDIFEDEYEFKDDRQEKLMKLINALLWSNSYESYCSSEGYQSEHGHAYFKAIDDEMNLMFVLRSMMGNEVIKQSFESETDNNSITVDGNAYLIDTPKALKDFFDLFPEMNRAATINGLASMIAKRIANETFTTEDVFETYNGLVDIYVNAMSRYSIYKVSNYDLPAKNDFSDLTHLLYLKDVSGRKMVSDDRIFKTLLGEDSLTFAEFLS